MNSPRASHVKARFGSFEMDLRAGELRKHGVRIRLQTQPFQILGMLLERPGDVVTREEMRHALWPGDTFVDFDHGLNNAINRLRETLGDSAESPRFLETLPRRGYRFIAAVESIAPPLPQDSNPNVADSSIRPTAPAGDKPAARPVESLNARLGTRLWIASGAGGAALLVLLVSLNTGGVRQRLLKASPARRIQSIAVLPLVNLSGDPSQEYFADGMTDELITQLSRSVDARVVSRTSIMRYKKSSKPLAQIGQELNVDAVVEGTVERSEGRVRIRVKLIRASTDQLIWAQSYDREMRDTLLLQSDVARDIVGEIHANLTTSEQNRLATKRQVDPRAYEDYLKGLYYSNKRSAANFRRAIEYLQLAIARDPSYAAAYAGLVDALVGEMYTGTPSDDVREQATEAGRKAVELDPSLSEAHFESAVIREVYDWDWSGAEKEYLRAIDLNQNLAAAHQLYAVFLAFQGRFDQAIAEAQRSQDLDPLSPFVRTTYCLDLYYSRRYDQAIEKCQQALELDPDFFHAHGNLADTYAAKGLYDRAFDEYQKTASIAGETYPRLVALKEAFHHGGIRNFWSKQLEAAREA